MSRGSGIGVKPHICRSACAACIANTACTHCCQCCLLAEEGLRRCLDLDPGDGRTYVVLGKLLTMNKRYDEARKLYTEGCQNTGEQGTCVGLYVTTHSSSFLIEGTREWPGFRVVCRPVVGRGAGRRELDGCLSGVMGVAKAGG